MLPIGVGEQLAHDLHEALLGHDVGHPPGVLLGEREEQRVLVAEVVEDRAPGQADGLLEPAHGGALVAVRGEAGARAVEDLLPSRREPVRADAGHVRDPSPT